MQPGAPSDKILGIELVRFASAVAVLVFHYQHFMFVGAAAPGLAVDRQPFYSILGIFYNYGFYGVEVFWCISGFIFFWKYRRPVAEKRVTGYEFFVLRFSRLYPLHFATLLAVAGMQWLYFARHATYFVYQNNDLYHFVLQLFMASNWGMQLGDSFNGPIWSISVEVLAYAFFFLTLRYVSSSLLYIAAVIVAAALMQILKISEHPIFPCLMFFYLGCLTAHVYQALQRHRLAPWPSGFAVLIAAAACLLMWHGLIKPKVFLVLFAPALTYLCVAHIPDSRLTARLLVPAGNITYASYLLHVPIQLALILIFGRLPFYSPYFFIGYLAGMLIVSHVTYTVFEMPAQRLLRGYLRSSRLAPSASLSR